jgi:phosphotransferase family enzyme
MSEIDVPLGRAAVRVGDTVRRPCAAWCSPVHSLLKHFRSQGVGTAPQVLGIDDQGREVLTWIEGESGQDALGHVRLELQSDGVLESMARLIRRLHDASSTFQWAEGGWQNLLREPNGSEEVICHNDISHSNTVFRGNLPSALVDWEFAAPGSRLWDLAYACWWLVPLHRPECYRRLGWREMDQPARLRLFCDAYGLGDERSDLMETIHARQLANQRQLRLWVDQGSIPRYDEGDPSIEVGRTDYVDSRRREFDRTLEK